ncbi:MAG: hypothetical protein ACI39U_06040 [Candidatus Cryptobacteroides sp.]
MKKENLILAVVVAAVSLPSCTKYSAFFLSGTYSCKNTGRMTVVLPESYLETEQDDIDLNETSTMDIRRIDGSDSVLIAFNPVGGELHRTTGHIDGARLEFKPFRREIGFYADTLKVLTTQIQIDTLVYTRNDTVKVRVKDNALMLFSGSAELYDDIVMFDMVCEGTSEVTGAFVSGDNIRLMAKKNK